MAKLIDSRLTVYLPYSYEPFIILKENYDRVDLLYKQNIGELLGYAYTGPHWIGLSICPLYYAIHMVASKTTDLFLYSFHVPSIHYTQEIVDHIINKKMVFEESLGKEGYKVKIKCGYMTAGNYEMQDTLPMV